MNTILGLGLIFLLALLAARLLGKAGFPGVTAYLVLGIVLGPSVTGLMTGEMLASSGFLSHVVLGVIAFSLGQNFTRRFFLTLGRPILWISILAVLFPCALVTVGAIVLGQPFHGDWKHALLDNCGYNRHL